MSKKTHKLHTIKGEQIRRQYLNTFLYEMLSVILPLTFLIPRTVDATQLKTGNPWTEALLFLITILILFMPLFSASFINRLFFGKLICVLTPDGIEYNEGRISWKRIESIEYEYNFPHSLYVTHSQYCCAHIHTVDGDITLYHAPYYLLGKAKKHNQNIKTKLHRDGIFRLLTTPVLVIIFLCIISFIK